jgi:hypothetical protein
MKKVVIVSLGYYNNGVFSVFDCDYDRRCDIFPYILPYVSLH